MNILKASDLFKVKVVKYQPEIVYAEKSGEEETVNIVLHTKPLLKGNYVVLMCSWHRILDFFLFTFLIVSVYITGYLVISISGKAWPIGTTGGCLLVYAILYTIVRKAYFLARDEMNEIIESS